MKNNALHISLICVIGIAVGAFIMFQMNISMKKLQLDYSKLNKDVVKINDDVNGLTMSISHLHKIINNNGVMNGGGNAITGTVHCNDSVCSLTKEFDKKPANVPVVAKEEVFDLVDLDDIIDEVEKKAADKIVEEAIENDIATDFDSMTYEDARELCKQRGLSPKGKKDQLIERLKNDLKTSQ
jgi:predicted transcriptional regulator